MPHNEQNVNEYHAGDALDLVVTVEDETGSPLDITNANEIDWLLKETETDADADALVTKDQTGGGVTITDGANGEFTVAIATGDTSGMDGTKHHRARVTDADGDRSTVFTGSFTISP